MKTLIGLGILLFIVGSGLMATIAGVQILYVAFNARNAEELTCDEFLELARIPMWLVLSNCEVDLPSLVGVTDSNNRSEYYAPILASDSQHTSALLKLTDRDADLVAAYYRAEPDSEASRKYLKEIVQRSFRHTLEAVVQVGVGKASEDTRRIIGREIRIHGDLELAANWQILEEGQPTSAWFGILLLIPGVGAIAFIRAIVRSARQDSRNTKAALEHAIETTTPADARSVDISGIARRMRQLEWARTAAAVVLTVTSVAAVAAIASALPPLAAPAAAVIVIAAGLLTLISLRQLARWLGLRLAWLGPLVIGVVVLGRTWWTGTMHQLEGKQVASIASVLIVGGMWMKWRTRVTVPALALQSIDLTARPRYRGVGFYPSRKYFTTAFCLTVSGAVYILGFAMAALLEGASKYLASVLPTRFGPNLTNMLGPFVVAPLMSYGSRAARMGRRYAAPKAAGVLARDRRPPVLLLRSFDDDELRFPPSGEIGHLLQSDRTFEESLVTRLWRYGPPLAIGKPGETLPMSGALREYIGHDNWQPRVGELLATARFIVVVLGRTEGLAWELDAVMASGFARKVILVAPPLSEDAISSRLTSLSAMLQEGTRARPFADSARVPGMICAVQRESGAVIFRAEKRDIRTFTTALDLAARACTSSL